VKWASVWEAAQPQQAAEQDMSELAQAARREIEAARAQFEEVHDPDLVDHAIYRLQAAERHYVYLMRAARG
jgi:hypothetical protein